MPPPPSPADPAHGARRVRPYALVRGRTRGRVDLPLEALVVRREIAASAPRPPEQQLILDATREPRSVVELASLLRVPVGVARVLIADLVAAGAAQVHHHTAADASAPPPHRDTSLLKDVLHGIERL